MPGALHGFKIVDLTQNVAGPLCTMILADEGAEVIKVEPLEGGDHTRLSGQRRAGFAASFLNNNRNKRSICIDLKAPEGVALVKRLCEGADVFMQNFRPGVVERLGLGEDEIRAVSPKIVYASVSGFGEIGPYAGKPVYDPVIQAYSGLATVQAGSDEARPRMLRTILPDKLTAITASQAVTAALLARERTGEGQHVRLSMLEAVLQFLWASDFGDQTFVGDEPGKQEAASSTDLVYETADGWITVAVQTNAQWVALTGALGKPEWLEDPRFRTPALRQQNVDDRLRLTQEVLKTGKSADWLDRLTKAQVPCAPVLTRNQVMRAPQVEALGLVVETAHHKAGKLRQTRPAARFSRTPSEIRRGGPGLGEDTGAILSELGLSATEIAALREVGVVNAA
ncbi:MAG TPA: CoA transferase [Stellaceae bacterium]|jgi:crotonobetainyl-CoA:carnitine CoA-transferase CaiB-like acyl-CoA transferase|nr:CoA transferase [Stellaceae bacterium]